MKNSYLYLVLIVISFVFVVSGCGSNSTGGGSSGGAAHIWVSTTGSDETGDGSYSNPYASIQKAMGVVSTGEIIDVLDGTYTGPVIWTVTAEGVTLKGASKTGTILQGGSEKCINIENVPNPQTIHIETMTITAGATSGSGGGIDLGEDNITLYLKDVVISGNSATSGTGGGLYVKYTTCTVEATNCSFLNNTASSNGGGVCTSSNLILEKCVISGNQSTGAAGGGLYFDTGSSGTLKNSIIMLNNSAGNAGGIYKISGALSLEVINCTLVSNETVGIGGAIRSQSAMTIKNCIIWGNKCSVDPQQHDIGGTSVIVVKYSDLSVWNPNLGGGPGTLEAVNPNFAKFPPTTHTDLKLIASSPASVTRGATKEAGIPSKDFDGTARTAPYSMGAFEKN